MNASRTLQLVGLLAGGTVCSPDCSCWTENPFLPYSGFSGRWLCYWEQWQTWQKKKDEAILQSKRHT